MKKSAITIMFCAIAMLTMPQQLHANVKQLLSPHELKAWIDNGYLTNNNRKVVILDTGWDWSNPPTCDQLAFYESGHIPGAYYVPGSMLYGGNFGLPRTDGPINVQGLVPNGPLMDVIIQSLGIDKDTVIVFTGSEVWNTTRAYWVFRYWGFSRNQLFILNGEANGYDTFQSSPLWRSVWEDAGYELETQEPELPEPSTFSVSEFKGNMDKVRASTEEFFMVAEGAIPNAVVFDSRAQYDWNAIIPIPGWNDTHVFAFRVKNSIWVNQAEFFVENANGTHVFKSKVNIIKMLKDRDKNILRYRPYSFCLGGGWATVCFFAYDAILKRPAKIHDGSLLELGQLGFLQDLALPEDSPWRFDTSRYCSIIHYNDPLNVIPPDIVDAYAPSANLVNEEDQDYYVGKKH